MSDPINPREVWQEGTLQNDVPANDNSLRAEALSRLVIGIEDSPTSTGDGATFIVGSSPSGAFAVFNPDDLTIYRDGTWYAWAPTEGLMVNLDGTLYTYDGSSGWVPIDVGTGVQSVVAGTNVTVDNTDPANPIVSATGGGGGGGDFERIGQVIVASPQTDIDFSSLDLDADTFYEIQLHHVPNASGAQSISMYYNSDFTATNYRGTYVGSDGSGTFGGNSSTANVVDSGATGSVRAARSTINISKASGSRACATSFFMRAVAGGGMGIVSIGHEWTASTANVTAIKLRNSVSNGFGVGTVVNLYRLN